MILKGDAERHRVRMDLIDAELREMGLYPNGGVRCTSITYFDSNGEQLGMRIHVDKLPGVRFLLYSMFDWERVQPIVAMLAESAKDNGSRLPLREYKMVEIKDPTA